MADIEERRAVIRFRIVGVHPVRALGGREATRPVVTELVRVRFTQRVRREVLETVRHALAQARLQPLVIASAARRRRRDVGDERRRREERTPILQRRPRRGIAGAGQRLVALDGRHEMCGVMTHVSDVRGNGRPHEVLGEHVPLLRELRPQIRIPGAHLARRLVERPQIREPGREAAAAGRRIVGDRRLEEERRVERQAKVGARSLHVLRDAVAAAHHPAFVGAPRQAEPRLEAFVVRLIERTRLATAVGRDDLLAGGQAEIRLAVGLLDDRLRVRPAQSEIERERLRHLVVVLHEERGPVVNVRPRLGIAAATLGPNLIEQEIGERESGEGAAVCEYPEQAVVAGVEAPLRVMQELSSDLQRVVALQPCDLVVELIRSIERVRIARARPDRQEPRVQRELAEAGDRLTAGNSERRVRIPDAGPIERLRHNRDLVVSNDRFVDNRRAEDAIPIEGHVAERRVSQRPEQQWNRPLVVLLVIRGH